MLFVKMCGLFKWWLWDWCGLSKLKRYLFSLMCCLLFVRIWDVLLCVRLRHFGVCVIRVVLDLVETCNSVFYCVLWIRSKTKCVMVSSIVSISGSRWIYLRKLCWKRFNSCLVVSKRLVFGSNFELEYARWSAECCMNVFEVVCHFVIRLEVFWCLCLYFKY